MVELSALLCVKCRHYPLDRLGLPGCVELLFKRKPELHNWGGGTRYDLLTWLRYRHRLQEAAAWSLLLGRPGGKVPRLRLKMERERYRVSVLEVPDVDRAELQRAFGLLGILRSARPEERGYVWDDVTQTITGPRQ